MNKLNYQKILEKTISDIEVNKKKPSLLLHSCCAPCSTYVLTYLERYFYITVFFYNPNIYPKEEYVKRLCELKKLINLMNNKDIKLIEGSYDLGFYRNFVGLEKEKEGGKRCEICYKLRLEETARLAKDQSYDYFTTTLTISPHKNADVINQIGGELEEKYNIKYLYSDFKKKEGYKESIRLSKQYDLYRQNYCGCVFSKDVGEGILI